MIVEILNQLLEHSKHYIQVREDPNLPMPGFSVIEKDLHGRYTPLILINQKLFPNDKNVYAHILAHEWGHHVCNHILLEPPPMHLRPKPSEIQEKENEADLFAAKFIKKYNYDVEEIANFMRDHPHDLDNRLAILFSQ